MQAAPTIVQASLGDAAGSNAFTLAGLMEELKRQQPVYNTGNAAGKLVFDGPNTVIAEVKAGEYFQYHFSLAAIALPKDTGGGEGPAKVAREGQGGACCLGSCQP